MPQPPFKLLAISGTFNNESAINGFIHDLVHSFGDERVRVQRLDLPFPRNPFLSLSEFSGFLLVPGRDEIPDWLGVIEHLPMDKPVWVCLPDGHDKNSKKLHTVLREFVRSRHERSRIFEQRFLRFRDRSDIEQDFFLRDRDRIDQATLQILEDLHALKRLQLSPQPRGREELDIKHLAEMRKQAVATPVAAAEPDAGGVDVSESAADESPPIARRTFPGSRRNISSPNLESMFPEDIPAPPAPPVSDTVDVSVFGPQTVRAGGGCLVQVFMHTSDQRAAAAALASEADPAAGRRGVKTLATSIARGTRVQVILEGRGLFVDEAMQELVWRGEPDACQFTVGIPADAAGKTFFPRILVLVNSVPVGAVTFALPVTADAAAQPTVIRGDEARRYSYAFLSYSSKDRAEVLKRAQGLRAGRIDFFQDLLSLEPGDHWAPRLYQEIDKCDLFLLFWSSHAKESPWVMKEVEYALARQKSSGGGMPDITPVIIEGPPPPSPPDSLKDIHFNDAFIYVLAAVEAEAHAPKPA